MLLSWYTIFYLFSILGNLAFGIGVLIAMSILLAVILCVVKDYGDPVPVWSKRLAWIAVVLILIQCFLPTKKDMLLIIAGGAAGEFITHNKDAQALPANVAKWLNAEVTTSIKELNPAYEAQKDKLKALSQEELVNLVLSKDSTSH